VLDDSKLQQHVTAELAWEPSVTAAHIGVIADNGIVTLTGHVPSYAEKQAAEMAARRVRGVKAVVEQIEVRLPGVSERSDQDIAAAAVNSFMWDVSVPTGAVTVVVEQGRVTLQGQVDRQFQREAAEQDVRRLAGVTSVTNAITLRPIVDASNLQDDITHALHRSWFFDPQTINVAADGGKVRLTGTVKTLHERQVAAATAWSAPGVTDVENELTVDA
jgi:osmotically-inducible protein OsmY